MTYKFPEYPIEIQSQKTGYTYTLIVAGGVQFDEAVIQITKICNEPEIYDNVFAAIFKGKRYTEDNARVFVKLVSEGFLNKTRFDWLILYDGAIVGTIGIKSLDGEIGYWQSNKHPGVMTLATQKLCSMAKEVGFSSLWAYVTKSNEPSIRVLEKAGFKLDKNLTEKREDVFGYRANF
jgi:RimJ/RimL family protein N-acetyltransferase